MKRWLISVVPYCDDQIYLQKISFFDHNRQFPRKLAVRCFTIPPTVSILWESYDRCSGSPTPCPMGRLAYKSSSKSRHRKEKYVYERLKLDLRRSAFSLLIFLSLPNALCCRRRQFFFMFYAVIDHNLLTNERSKIPPVIVHVKHVFLRKTYTKRRYLVYVLTNYT